MKPFKLSGLLKTVNPVWLRLSAVFLSAAVITAVVGFGILDTFDQPLSDRFYQKSGAADRDIVVIGIDQASLDVLGPMPWPRNYMAEAIACLNNTDPDAKPAVIGIDILYLEMLLLLPLLSTVLRSMICRVTTILLGTVLF